MRILALISLVGGLVGCYTGAPAERDVSAAWRGHTRAEIEHRWGAPANRAETVSTWTHDNVQIELPTGGAALAVGPDRVDFAAVFQPGAIWHTTTAAAALIDPPGTIARVEGASLRWGPPNDANLHWGTVFGMHVGMGRLDSTSTPLPSGGAYIGGMLSPTLALVGTFSLASGTGPNGGAMGMAGGMAVQWWPETRISFRAGPAMLLAFDPGFANARLRPGGTASASYAFVKVGRFAVDLRLEAVAGPSVVFGSAGVGVNLN